MRLLILMLAVFEIGCVQSLQPIVDPARSFQDDALIGSWSNGAVVLDIEPSAGPTAGYGVTHAHKGKKLRFNLQVARYGDHTYWQVERPDPDDSMRLSMYQFGHYDLDGDKLTLRLPDGRKWMSTLGSEGMRFVERDGYIILTSPPSRIGALLSKTGDQLFSKGADIDDPNTFKRMKTSSVSE